MYLTIAFAIIIGLAVGIVVGVLGAGGGILAVPALTYLLHQSPHAAAMGSLLIVLATAVVALPNKLKHQQVRIKQGIAFGAISIVGSFIGSRLSIFVPGNLLMLLFAAMLAVMSVVMIRRGLRERQQLETDLPTRPGSLTAVILAALATGFLTGFFGVGGGFMVVPVLTVILAFPMRQASGTSLLIMILASAAGLASRYGQDIDVSWTIVIAFMVGSMLGGIVGGPLSNRTKPSTLTLTFGYLLALVCVVSVAATTYQMVAA